MAMSRAERAERKRRAAAERRQQKLEQEIEGFEDRQFLDGKKLVEWLWAEHGNLMDGLTTKCGESVSRRVYDWRTSDDALHYSSADLILTRMGIHLDSEVPDECWIEGMTRRPLRKVFNARPEGERLLRQGKLSTDEIAKQLGVATSTVKRWKTGLNNERRKAEADMEGFDPPGQRRGFEGLIPHPSQPGIHIRAGA